MRRLVHDSSASIFPRPAPSFWVSALEAASYPLCIGILVHPGHASPAALATGAELLKLFVPFHRRCCAAGNGGAPGDGFSRSGLGEVAVENASNIVRLLGSRGVDRKSVLGALELGVADLADLRLKDGVGEALVLEALAEAILLLLCLLLLLWRTLCSGYLFDPQIIVISSLCD